jgi:hypothetical protein
VVRLPGFDHDVVDVDLDDLTDEVVEAPLHTTLIRSSMCRMG